MCWANVLSLSYLASFLFVFLRGIIWPNLALNSLYKEEDREEGDLGFLTLSWNYRNR